MRIWLLAGLLLTISTLCYATETFEDVPEDHWAAESVELVAEAGIMQGYPDNKFDGNKPVTRYELAVALANFVEYVRATEKPLIDSNTELSLNPPKHWADSSITYLRNGSFIPQDSILLQNGERPVTQDDLARVLASVGAQLMALRAPTGGTE